MKAVTIVITTPNREIGDDSHQLEIKSPTQAHEVFSAQVNDSHMSLITW